MEQLSQQLAVVGHAAAGSQVSGTVLVSSPVDMMVFRRCLVLVDVGVFPSGTAVLSFNAANNVAFTTAGTNSQGVTNTTVTAGGTIVMGATAATRVEELEIRSDQLPTGTRWIQPQISVSSGAIPVFGVIVLGGEAEYKPASQFNSTGYASGTTGSQIVDQIVVT